MCFHDKCCQTPSSPWHVSSSVTIVDTLRTNVRIQAHLLSCSYLQKVCSLSITNRKYIELLSFLIYSIVMNSLGNLLLRSMSSLRDQPILTTRHSNGNHRTANQNHEQCVRDVGEPIIYVGFTPKLFPFSLTRKCTSGSAQQQSSWMRGDKSYPS